MYSLSKSFTSTAVGFAVAEGKLGIFDPVLKFFPAEAPAAPSGNLKAMRVRDLLAMATGHQDEPPTSPDKIEGISLGGYGLRVKTEDIAKLGQLYLQKGAWKGKQLLPDSESRLGWENFVGVAYDVVMPQPKYLELFETFDPPFGEDFDNSMLGEEFPAELQTASRLWVETGYGQGIAGVPEFLRGRACRTHAAARKTRAQYLAPRRDGGRVVRARGHILSLLPEKTRTVFAPVYPRVRPGLLRKVFLRITGKLLIKQAVGEPRVARCRLPANAWLHTRLHTPPPREVEPYDGSGCLDETAAVLLGKCRAALLGSISGLVAEGGVAREQRAARVRLVVERAAEVDACQRPAARG